MKLIQGIIICDTVLCEILNQYAISCSISPNRKVSVELACKDTLFYCTMDEDKNLKLAWNHQNCHQVHLQLFTRVQVSVTSVCIPQKG